MASKHPGHLDLAQAGRAIRVSADAFGLQELPALLSDAPARLMATTECAARAVHAYYARCTIAFGDVLCGPLVYLGDGWGFALVQAQPEGLARVPVPVSRHGGAACRRWWSTRKPRRH